MQWVSGVIPAKETPPAFFLTSWIPSCRITRCSFKQDSSIAFPCKLLELFINVSVPVLIQLYDKSLSDFYCTRGDLTLYFQIIFFLCCLWMSQRPALVQNHCTCQKNRMLKANLCALELDKPQTCDLKQLYFPSCHQSQIFTLISYFIWLPSDVKQCSFFMYRFINWVFCDFHIRHRIWVSNTTV